MSDDYDRVWGAEAAKHVAAIRGELAKHRRCAVVFYDLTLHDEVMRRLSPSERDRVVVEIRDPPDLVLGDRGEKERAGQKLCKWCGCHEKADTEYGPLCYGCGAAWDETTRPPYAPILRWDDPTS